MCCPFEKGVYRPKVFELVISKSPKALDKFPIVIIIIIIPTGTLAFDNHSGFWLIHSAPQFPPKQKDGYRWAYNACDFGQTFLCVSFAYKSLDVLGKHQLKEHYSH